MVLADKNSLLIAFKNVIENSMKFSLPQNSILIVIGQSSKRLSVSVKDTGCGIDPTVGDRPFEKYYRGDNVDLVSGSGIGLFIVRHIIQAHNGKVSIKNRKSGGCQVDIVLPINYRK